MLKCISINDLKGIKPYATGIYGLAGQDNTGE